MTQSNYFSRIFGSSPVTSLQKHIDKNVCRRRMDLGCLHGCTTAWTQEVERLRRQSRGKGRKQERKLTPLRGMRWIGVQRSHE